MKRLALAIVLCMFWGESKAAEQSARDPLDPLSSTGRLFSDPPVNQAKRTLLVKEIARASNAEKIAILSFLKACIPNDKFLHRDEQKSKKYYISCKQAVDSWRVDFDQYNPGRVIDEEVDIFVQILHWVKVSGQQFSIIDDLFDARRALASQDNKPLDTKSYVKYLELINATEKDIGIYFKRAQWFIGGLTKVMQEARPVARRKAAAATTSRDKTATTRKTIVSIQTSLSALYYNPGPADGILGPQTRSAIEAFQRDHSMPVTGEVSSPLRRQILTERSRRLSAGQKPKKVELFD